MSFSKPDADVLVVGAGLSGLIAAHVLRAGGYRVLMLEQNPQVGGRLDTVAMGPGLADTGAQFFTIRSREFQQWVEAWQIEGLVYRWSTGWSSGSLAPVNFDGHPRYAVRGGMAALAEYLAQQQDIRLDVLVESVAVKNDVWECRDQQDTVYRSRALLLTPPPPQSLALLAVGPIQLAPADRATLEKIDFTPCLTGLYLLSGPIHLPEPGAIQHSYAPISWLADNRRKGISPDETVVTVQAGPTFSRRLWAAPDEDVLGTLRIGFLPYLPANSEVIEARLKRWQYATPVNVIPEPCLLAANLPPLVFAGDAFGGPRVEGAVLSGQAAAKQLMAIL